MKFTEEALNKAKVLFMENTDSLEYLQSLEKLKGSDCYHIGNGCWMYEDYCRGYILKVIGDVITAITDSIYEPHNSTYYKPKNIVLVAATDESIVYDGDTLKKLCDANYD